MDITLNQHIIKHKNSPACELHFNEELAKTPKNTKENPTK
jgi:hypothetical protein